MISFIKELRHLRNLVVSELADDAENQCLFPLDPVLFAEYTRTIRGQKFSLADRPYLHDIYKDYTKEVYIVKGRQTEITEFAINWLCHRLLTHPGTTGLYVTDRESHVRIFSEDRLLNGTIRCSPNLQQAIPLEDHLMNKQNFSNESVLYIKSGWEKFEQARSIAADFVVVDEAQSLEIEELDVVRETLSHSKFSQLRVIGTGSEEGSAWQKLHSSGTCFQWHKRLGVWVPKNPEAINNSYHVPQTIVPWITPEQIEAKRLEMSPRRFATEVLGEWYRGMRKPLVDADIRSLMDKSLDFTAPINVDYTLGPVYAGIDWGGGVQAYTVVWIWQLINADVPRFKLLYATKYDEEEDRSVEKQVEKVSHLIDIYEVDKVVMDAGGGPYQVERLSKRYAERVYKCVYTPRPELPFEQINSEFRVNVDRTWVIETIIDLITRPEKRDDFPHPIPRIVLPGIHERLEEIEWMIDHFTCIEAETTNATGRSRKIYTHPNDTNDDALHACCYAFLASLLDRKFEWKWFRF